MNMPAKEIQGPVRHHDPAVAHRLRSRSLIVLLYRTTGVVLNGRFFGRATCFLSLLTFTCAFEAVGVPC
jgi:hypothetical protein